MLLGIWLRIIEINRFEKAHTVVSAMHMTSATHILVVTANAEQIPKICNPIGLLLNTGLIKTSFEFIASLTSKFL